jgi:hypothetical protein
MAILASLIVSRLRPNRCAGQNSHRARRIVNQPGPL